MCESLSAALIPLRLVWLYNWHLTCKTNRVTHAGPRKHMKEKVEKTTIAGESGPVDQVTESREFPKPRQRGCQRTFLAAPQPQQQRRDDSLRMSRRHRTT